MQTCFVQIITVLIESVVVLQSSKAAEQQSSKAAEQQSSRAAKQQSSKSKSIATESKSIFKAVASLRV